MPRHYTRIAFTDSVQRAQERYGGRDAAARVAGWSVDDRTLTARERDHVEARDGFYMATVSEDGWPYVQFRGGPPGFLKVLDEHTLGFADLRGNRQYVSTGNLSANDRVALILMDYPRRARLKLYARAEVHAADERPELLARLADPADAARAERVVLLHVEAFDWNCPQHITPRWSEAELAAAGRLP